MLRPDTKAAIDRYVDGRIPTGSFLRAVLENNLMEAMGRADIGNRHSLFEICEYIYNNIPLICHGSPERVKNWLKGKDNESNRHTD